VWTRHAATVGAGGRHEGPVSPHPEFAFAAVPGSRPEDPMADALKPCSHDHRQREFDDENERVGHGLNIAEAPMCLREMGWGLAPY
jgi:hypothetical protein